MNLQTDKTYQSCLVTQSLEFFAIMATQHPDVLECARTQQKKVKNLKESCPNSLRIWVTFPDTISSLKLVNQT